MSIRDRLRGRSLPTEVVTFPADRAAYQAAHEDLAAAAAAVAEALRSGPAPEEVVAAEQAAQARVDELDVHSYTVRALRPPDWEALVAQHPAQREQDQRDGFHPETFYPALLEETVTLATDDGPVSSTAAEWGEMFAAGELTLAEKNTLLRTAWDLNTSAAVVPASVGKGSGPTRP